MKSKLDSLIEELDSINLNDIELPKNITDDYFNKIKNDINSIKLNLVYLKTGKITDDRGRIPPYIECPYKSKCTMANNCYHLGREHSVAFSCLFARAFEA